MPFPNERFVLHSMIRGGNKKLPRRRESFWPGRVDRMLQCLKIAEEGAPMSKLPLDLELALRCKLGRGGGTMKIAEVSEQYGISTDTLRYYERIGLIPPVNRNGSGIRDYNDLDIQRVEFIKCMRSAGLPIEVLIDYMELIQQGDRTIAARKDILKEQRDLLVERIREMQATLDLLNHKIQVYENAILTKEQAIVQLEE